MAIVGLVVMGLAEHMEHIRALLDSEPDVVEVQSTKDATRLAVVLETGADKVEGAMSHMLTWDGILTVDLAYVSYEDDLEAGGIACPPHSAHKPRKVREAGE